MSLLQKLFQKYLRKFFLTEGRSPGTPKEWMDIQDLAVREINKTKGVPKKDIPPFQGWNPKIVKKGGIEELLEGPVRSEGPKGDRIWDFSKPKKKGEVIDFPKKKASGGRIGMAGGGALFKFIEKLFIKASNDIRLGKGKWKGLDQKQIAVQHDNLTKKVVEFQKSGKTVGLEEYFGINPEKAFAATQKTVKKERTMDDLVEDAYKEVFYQKPPTHDYKYDAQILADEIALKGGKIFDDLSSIEQSSIYDLALKRVSKDLQINRAKKIAEKNLIDLEQKIELQMFDPKDKTKQASGGLIHGYNTGGVSNLFRSR